MKRNSEKSVLPVALIARGAIYIALGCVILFLSSVLETFDMVLATIVTVFIYVARLEHGGLFALLVYAGISILSIVLIPTNTGAILFALVFGWFPLLYALLLKKTGRPALSKWIGCLAFALSMILVVFLFRRIFLSQSDSAEEILRVLSFFSVDTEKASLWLAVPIAGSFTRAQGISAGLYAAFSLVFAVVFLLFFDRFTPVYIYRIRPILEKARIVGKTNKK